MLSGGEIRINKRNIVSQTIIVENKNSTIADTVIAIIESDNFFEDPTRSKLFFAPTAKNMKSLSGTVALHAIISPYVNLGITDRVSIGGYLIPLPFNSFFAFISQVNIYSNQFYDIATGIFYLKKIKKQEDDNYFLYGVTTYSNKSLMFNIGSGYSPISKNYFLFWGGEISVSDDLKILSDNWFLSSGTTSLSLGILV